MNINHKIRKDLIERSHPSPSHAAQILAHLIANNDKPVSLSVIAEQMRKSMQATWPAAYDLAAMGKIGFADRKYHLFDSHPELKNIPKQQRIAVWHKSHDIQVAIRPQWATLTNNEPQIRRDQIIESPILLEPVQPSLFDIDPESMSNSDLDAMIQRLQTLKITREIDKRYEGAPTKHKAALLSVLTAYGVADPVALVHADEQITFLTLTNTKAMPLQVTLKQAGKPCETVYLEHITLYRAPVISAIQEAYKAATQRSNQ
tara:strand:- start:799 stop:1578 length:780 start_codon:yes stop_codon:yes gene_type:complete